MPIRTITATGDLGLERGSAAVFIPLVGGNGQVYAEMALATAESVIVHTAVSTPLLVGGSPEQIESVADELRSKVAGRSVLSLSCDPAAGETHAVNLAVRASFPADLVVVAPGVRVAANWLERLRRAATSDSTVASATPLSLGAGALGLDAEDPGTAGRLDTHAHDVHARGMQLFPRIAAIGPGCAYVRRTLLELVGPLDETMPLGVALTHLATQAIAAGMVHVAADDTVVEGLPAGTGGSITNTGELLVPAEEQVQETLLQDERARLRRAIAVARTALHGLSVTIDGRALTSTFGGTQTYIIELIMALARRRDITLRVLIPPDLSPRAASALATLADVELLHHEQVIDGVPLTDVVHRPQPAFTPDDVTLLRMVGERIVIGQLDLIAYHNYSYHRDIDHWRAYRRTTRLALGGADQVVFFSEHARRDALAEDLLPAARTHVVGIGVDMLERASAAGAPPDGFRQGDSFLLCLGADYAHKNRCFAIELLGALRERGWAGKLVLAGGHVPFGSSRERERELLARRTDIAPFVEDLGTVEESSKQWLLEQTRALLYPTLYEGFGLLPLEAARAGVPCLFARQASLIEVAGRAATLTAWDAQASACAVLPLLAEGPAREAHLADLGGIPATTWAEVSSQLVAIYEHALAATPAEAAPRIWQELDRESYIVRLDQAKREVQAVAQEYQDAYHDLSERVSSGLPLIDRGGLLTTAQQRGLMRIASRRGLGRALLAPLSWLGKRRATRSASSSREGADH
jgi:glycosyltransferase involved in cell wall biosynthesis